MGISIALCFFGLLCLLGGAHALVTGGSNLAKQWRISPGWIGFIFIAIGTSLPEFTVSVFAGLKEETALVMGNILGSNAANAGLILGLTLLVKGIKTKKEETSAYIQVVLLATALTAILGYDGTLSQIDGGILFLCGIATFWKLWQREQRKAPERIEENRSSILRNLGWVTGGALLLWGGGRALVDGAIHLAQASNTSQEFIGLSFIALGTSLPELITSLMAAYRREPSMAIGNILGSNATNLFFILGSTALLKPIPLTALARSYDLPVVLLMTGVSSWILLKTQHLNRGQGILLLTLYFVCLTAGGWLHLSI